MGLWDVLSFLEVWLHWACLLFFVGACKDPDYFSSSGKFVISVSSIYATKFLHIIDSFLELSMLKDVSISTGNCYFGKGFP